MAKKRKCLRPGDTFAVPLEDGRFSACRVVQVREDGAYLVVGCAFIGAKLPALDDPALKTTLLLTHHNFEQQPCCVWIHDPPPHFYLPLGNLPLCPTDKRLKLQSAGTGGWAYFSGHPLMQWQWDHPEDIPPPEPKAEGKFILHRFNGDEVYGFERAVIFAGEHGGKVTLWLEVESAAEGAQRCADTESMGMAPNAETGIQFQQLDASRLVGSEFFVSGEEDDESQSILYYCEHEPLLNNRITILAQQGDRFRIRWTGETQDVNYYDGSKPLTKVEIEGEFKFKEYQHWARAPDKPPRRKPTKKATKFATTKVAKKKTLKGKKPQAKKGRKKR